MTNQEKQNVHKTTATLNQKELFALGFTRKLIKTLNWYRILISEMAHQ